MRQNTAHESGRGTTGLQVLTSAQLAALQPTSGHRRPYQQTPPNASVTMFDGSQASAADAAQLLEVDYPLQRYGCWVVTSYGLDCLSRPYVIEAARLAEDWELHMVEKTWMEELQAYRDFVEALYPGGQDHRVDGRRDVVIS